MLADPGIVREVLVHDLSKFRVLHVGRAATNREHVSHVGISKTFQKNAMPYHAGGAEQDDSHAELLDCLPRFVTNTLALSHDQSIELPQDQGGLGPDKRR